MIIFKNVTLRRGNNILLKNINWSIYPKQRIGMIGANGAGKSSLFALLLKRLSLDEGEIEYARPLKFAHVAQETEALSQSALDFVLDGDTELRTLQAELQEAEEKNEGTRIAVLHEKLSFIDAYSADARAQQLLTGLGFDANAYKKSVMEFSGGWRVRLNLAKALMCRSDILLLDEPTNHLDLDAILWLEEWLKKYQGTLILISHDREFLDEIVDHIVYLSDQQLKLYTGNYSSFEKIRAAQLLQQQAAYEKQQRQVAHMQDFINRFRAKATKARQAQSRIKALERMEMVCAIQTQSPFNFEFKKPADCPNPLISCDRVRIAYENKIVLNHINFSIAPKERIGILGPNGAGKSTFIKMLAGEIPIQTGECAKSSGLKIGYFAQHQVDALNVEETPLWHLKQLAPKVMELDLRKFLGGFGFSGDEVLKAIKNFSGGEKSRLALALLVYQKPNLLLLDEPTNHLDLEMRQALSLALQDYEGAMLLVSHDRFLVKTTTDQLLLIADGKVENFNGDLNDYQQWLINYRKQKNPSVADERKMKRQEEIKNRQQLQILDTKIKKLEKELENLQKAYDAQNLILSENSLYEASKKEILHQHLQKLENIKKMQENTLESWLNAAEERDQLK